MRLIFFLFLIISLVPVNSQAQTADLYAASVAVDDQSQSVREEAFPGALTQVLGKLSGLREPDQIPEVVEAVKNARSLVVSFYYEQVAAFDDERHSAGQDTEEQVLQTYIAVRFEQTGVDEMLRALGLPKWPPGRAPLSVWLLIDDGLSRQVLPLEYEYLRDPLDRVATVRGLPLVWPKPGEDGNYSVDVQLLWGGYTDQLESRGESGEVLIITARREGPEWSARLILEYEEENWSWRSRNIDLQEVLTASMQQVVDEIAAVNAIAAAAQGKWVHQISIGGLTSSEDYVRCLAYLESLNIVDEVAVTAANPASVSMAVVLNAAPEYLQEALDGDRVLESEDGSGHYILQQ